MITEVTSTQILLMLLFQLLSSQTVESFKDEADAGCRQAFQEACCHINDVIQSHKLTPIPSATNYKGPADQLWLGFQRIITNQILKDIQLLLTFLLLNIFHFYLCCFLFVFAFLLDFTRKLSNRTGFELQERSDYNNVTLAETYLPKTVLLLVNKPHTPSVPLSFSYLNTNKIILWILAISPFSK